MKRVYRLLLVLVPVLFFQCQKGVDVSFESNNNNNVNFKGTVQGNILDENGKPAANVQVTVGSTTINTDARGYFRITNVALNKNLSMVTAEKQGYFKAYRSFNATSGANQVLIRLVKKSLVGTVNASSGGEVSLSNGAKIALPANSVMLASGASYSGSVKMYASFIDPSSSEISQTVPGSFMADDINNKRVALASYGMMAVELESSTGEKLQIKSGSTAQLTSPIPSALQASAPASISLWYMDEKKGIWKEEGVATKNGNTYIGEVKHFSFWNCDIGLPAVNISLTIKNNKSVPLVHVLVRIKTNGAAGYAYGWTDSLGHVSGLVPSNENLILEVLDPCNNVAYSQNIGPFAQATDLGTITVPAIVVSSVTVKGKLQNCTGAAVTKGYAIVRIDNMSRYVSVNQNGEFSASFLACSASGSNVEVLGVDDGALQQGTVQTFPVVLPETNTGNISACGTSTATFINYTLDGTTYSLANIDSIVGGPDSLMLNSTPVMGTQIAGDDFANGKSIQFQFTGVGAGVHPMAQLSVQSFKNVSLVQPFNVTLTAFAQNTGSFYEGSFTGQFKDAQSLTHNISASFKVRRRW